MKNLKEPGATQAQVRTQSDDALVAYAAATGAEVGALNDVSPVQVRTQVDAGNAAYDAATGDEAFIIDEKVDAIDAEVEVVTVHLHSREHWCGKSGDQSGNNWGADTLTPYRAISGNGVYGADASDEAKVIGSADTPVVTGKAFFDLHRITIIAISSDTVYKMRLVWGTGTMAAAITANQMTELMIITSTDKANKFGGAPFDIRMPRIAAGTKIWMQARNVTNDATVDFFVGLHEYNA